MFIISQILDSLFPFRSSLSLSQQKNLLNGSLVVQQLPFVPFLMASISREGRNNKLAAPCWPLAFLSTSRMGQQQQQQQQSPLKRTTTAWVQKGMEIKWGENHSSEQSQVFRLGSARLSSARWGRGLFLKEKCFLIFYNGLCHPLWQLVGQIGSFLLRASEAHTFFGC